MRLDAALTIENWLIKQVVLLSLVLLLECCIKTTTSLDYSLLNLQSLIVFTLRFVKVLLNEYMNMKPFQYF